LAVLAAYRNVFASYQSGYGSNALAARKHLKTRDLLLECGRKLFYLVDKGLQSLFLCTDDKVVRVLRRVLSEMDIAVELCSDADAAMQKLTRQRFEAVIVDCDAHASSLSVLKGTRSAPANKRAITVAVIESEGQSHGHVSAKDVFALGTHFVLFKPLSLERTRSSFRAVRALMKRERRRHVRIPIELPVQIGVDRQGSWKGSTADLGENGMALKTQNVKLPAVFRLSFTLPGASASIDCNGEVAWQGNNLAGIRFSDLSVESSDQLKQWIEKQLLGPEAEEVTVSCKLTDLSPGGCYLETESPFPVRTLLRLMMKVGEHKLQIEGIVRVIHPGAGMGVEFTQHTSTEKTRVEEFIQTLVNTDGAVPELQVRPDSIDNASSTAWEIAPGSADPLLSLFLTKADVDPDLFQQELKKQRGTEVEANA
jgi:DNA-binding response OmpR family regulator